MPGVLSGDVQLVRTHIPDSCKATDEKIPDESGIFLA
jgi:hypothetical protein